MNCLISSSPMTDPLDFTTNATGTSPAASSLSLLFTHKKKCYHACINYSFEFSVEEKKKKVNSRDNSGISNVRVSNEHGFELGGGDLEALVLNDLLQPIDNEELVVVVDIANVAGVQPPFLVDRHQRRRRVIKIPCIHIISQLLVNIIH